MAKVSKVSMSVVEVFDKCQHGLQCHSKLIKSMFRIQESMEFDKFWSEFEQCLKYSMLIFKREPAVERTIDFVAKYVTTANTTEGTESMGEESNKLLMALFQFLLQSHSSKDRSVRFRCCQMINKLLGNLGEEAQIEDDLYEEIYTAMLERLQDRVSAVRMYAVLALARLQDPTDLKCPVIKAYLFLLSRDPHFGVRKIVLSCIAPSTKTLLPIIERTRDVSDVVRKMAYSVIAEKIHIKALSIGQRIQLLKDGLSDRSDAVKEACATKLLQTWLLQFQGSALQLLECLDVEESAELCQKVLYKLFEKAPVEELVEYFDLLNESHIIPDDKLTSESAMYWRVICQYVHERGPEHEESLEKVLPTCLELCRYVRKFLEKLTNCGDDFEQQLELEYVCEQILTLFKFMDLTDMAGHRELQKLLHDLLTCDFVSHALVSPIISTLYLLKTNTDSLVAYLAEVISEIREPISVCEKSVEEDEQRTLDRKIANVRVRQNELKEEMDECVRTQEFVRAAELKLELSALDAKKIALLDEGEPQQEEVRIEKNDSFTILKCLTIICQLNTQLRVKTLTPTLQMLLESQVLPGVQNADAAIRNTAVRALGLCCLLKEEIVMQYLPLLIEITQHDTDTVKSSALCCLFDIVHLFGLGIIKDDAVVSDQEAPFDASSQTIATNTTLLQPDETMSVNETRITAKKNNASIAMDIATKLITLLSNFLDSESSELRTVAAEGLAKMLMSGRVVSSKLLSHLTLLWYNPLTDGDNHLRHCLGAFFPMFAFSKRSNQELLEECFLPTMTTLMNAPLSSPLSEVNAYSVATFLLQLVNCKLLLMHNTSQNAISENPGHDNMAELICNEILDSPDSFDVKLWTKLFTQLDLSPDPTKLRSIDALCDRMLEDVKDKPSIKAIQKFKTYVGNLVKGDGANSPCGSPTVIPESDISSLTTDTTCLDIASVSSEPRIAIPDVSQSQDSASQDSVFIIHNSESSVSVASLELPDESGPAAAAANTRTRRKNVRKAQVKLAETPVSSSSTRTTRQSKPSTSITQSGDGHPLRGARTSRIKRRLQDELEEARDQTSTRPRIKTPTRTTRSSARTPKRTALTDVND